MNVNGSPSNDTQAELIEALQTMRCSHGPSIGQVSLAFAAAGNVQARTGPLCCDEADSRLSELLKEYEGRDRRERPWREKLRSTSVAIDQDNRAYHSLDCPDLQVSVTRGGQEQKLLTGQEVALQQARDARLRPHGACNPPSYEPPKG